MSIRKITYRDGSVGYRVVVDIAPEGEPRRQQTRTFSNRREAVDWQAEVMTDRKRGTHVAPDFTTFDDLADEWLAVKERTTRTNTFGGYKTDLKHPRAAFGNKPLQKITERDIEVMVTAMVKKQLSKRTVSKALTTLRSALDLAVRRRAIPSNPAAASSRRPMLVVCSPLWPAASCSARTPAADWLPNRRTISWPRPSVCRMAAASRHGCPDSWSLSASRSGTRCPRRAKQAPSTRSSSPPQAVPSSPFP